MKKLHMVILLTSIFILFVSTTMVFSAIDPGSWYYDKTVNLVTGETARLYFPQASLDNGEKDHHLTANPEDPNSVFENFFTNAQAGKFYLLYDGNDIVDEMILMVALGEDYDEDFSMGLQWRINNGTQSQNIPLESADFNNNEYGYYPQWWKVARDAGKLLISTGSDQDQYYVVYVNLGFDGDFMEYGDVLEIKYAISNFNDTSARLIFNVYGSEDGEDFFRWTNKNTNTFGVKGKAASSQQQIPPYFYPYPTPNIYYGQLWPGTAWGPGWGYSSPAGPYYGYSFGAPYSFLSGFYAGGMGYQPGGYYSNFGVSPLSGFYSSWSYSPFSLFNYSGFGYGGYSFGYGGSQFSSFYPGSYYRGYYSSYF